MTERVLSPKLSEELTDDEAECCCKLVASMCPAWVAAVVTWIALLVQKDEAVERLSADCKRIGERAARTVWAAVAVFVALFGLAASVSWRATTRVLRKREARRNAQRAAALALLLLPHRHRVGRHRCEHELPLALLSKSARPFRDVRDRAPVTFGVLLVVFSVLIGAAQ